MPPEGFTTVTISENVVEKLARIMALHDCSSYPEAIEYVTDTTLVCEDENTVPELIHLLAKRVDELDDSNLQ